MYLSFKKDKGTEVLNEEAEKNVWGKVERTGDTPQQIAGIYGNIGSSVSTQILLTDIKLL